MFINHKYTDFSTCVSVGAMHYSVTDDTCVCFQGVLPRLRAAGVQ